MEGIENIEFKLEFDTIEQGKGETIRAKNIRVYCEYMKI